jgi:hypothetical protein
MPDKKTKTLIATIRIYSDGSVVPVNDADEARKAKLRHDWHTKYKPRYAKWKARKRAVKEKGLHPCETCGIAVKYIGRGRPPKWCERHTHRTKRAA